MHQHDSEPPLRYRLVCCANIQAASFFGVRGFQACQLMSSSAVIHRHNSNPLPQQSNAGRTIRRWARAQGSFLEIKINPWYLCNSFKMICCTLNRQCFLGGVTKRISRQAGGLSDRLISRNFTVCWYFGVRCCDGDVSLVQATALVFSFSLHDFLFRMETQQRQKDAGLL